MILADKIIKLRKKNGWSQEELADKMNVSRQAVSKREAAQTTPDLEKILQLGNLFGVTTDYLLKDEMEDAEFTDSAEDAPVRKISLAQANEYIAQRKEASKKIALATFLCIASVIPLLLLTALSQHRVLPISEDVAAGIGVVAIFPIVAIAVTMFIRTGFKNEPYEFLEEEPYETEYGVTGLAKERQKAYRDTYMKCNYIGVSTCVLSPVPLLCGVFAGNELLMMILLCVTILMVGIATMLLIVAGVRWASLQRLLKEGEYSQKRKKSKLSETIETIYWLAVTAIYLGWSFLSGDWGITWIVWPVAAVLSAGVELICKLWLDKKE